MTHKTTVAKVIWEGTVPDGKTWIRVCRNHAGEIRAEERCGTDAMGAARWEAWRGDMRYTGPGAAGGREKEYTKILEAALLGVADRVRPQGESTPREYDTMQQWLDREPNSK